MNEQSSNPFDTMTYEELVKFGKEQGWSVPEQNPYKYNSLEDQLKERREKLPGELKDAGRRFLGGARSALAGIGDIVGSGDSVAHNIDVLTHGKLRPRSEEEENSERLARPLASLLPGAAATKAISKLGAPVLKGASGYAERGLRHYLNAQKIEPGVKSYGATGAATLAGQHGAEKLSQSNYFNPEADPILSKIESTMRPAVGGILGGAGVGTAANSLPNVVRGASRFVKHPIDQTAKGLSRIARVNPIKVEDFESSNIRPLLPEITDSKPLKMASNMAFKMGAKPVEEVIKNRPKEFMKSIGVSEEHGTRADLGRKIQQTAKEGYDKESHTSMHKIANFENTRHDAGLHHLDLSDYRNLLERNMPVKYGEDMAAWAKTSAGKLYKNLVKNDIKTKKAPWDYGELRKNEIKSLVKEGWGIPADPQKALLEQAYGKILEAEENSLKNIKDPSLQKKAQGQFSDYRKHWTLASEEEKQLLKEVQKDRRKGADFISKKFFENFKSGRKDLEIVLKHIPKDEHAPFMNDFMHSMALDPKGNFNATLLAKKYFNLPPEQQEVLGNSLKMSKATLDKSMRTLGHASETIAESNFSGSGIHNNAWAKAIALAGAASKAALGSGVDAAAAVTGAVTAITTWGMSAAANKYIFANKKLTDFLIYGSKVKDPHQVPILLRKLGEVPGIPKNMVDKFKNVYSAAYKGTFNKADHLKAKGLLASLQSPGYKNEREKDR